MTSENPAAALPYEITERAAARGVNWLAGALLVLALILFMALLQLFQASSEGPATSALRRSVAALTEVDVLVDQQYDALVAQAKAAEGESITIEEYPLAIELRADEVAAASREELREMIVAESAALMYEEGTSAWRAEGGGDPSRFSAAGAVDRSLNLLREDIHTYAGIALIVVGAVAAALAVLLASSCRGYRKLGAVGAAIAVAAVPVLLTGWLSRTATSSADVDHYLRYQLYGIGHGLATIPVRTGFAFLALGLAFVAIAVVAEVLTRPRNDTAA